MASTEAPAAQSTNGGQTRPDIEVENPATGQVIATVPDLGPDEVKGA
jgi:acyl-CoA reductase-like NAD-dependent aldehyde dehydrogenase